MKNIRRASNSKSLSSPRVPSDDSIFPVKWYAVAWSSDLHKHPLKTRLIGQDLVLFRDRAGRVHCLSAYCTHRGADLSLGHCLNETIECAYHGWQFSGDGNCVRIPAHPDRPIPDFARISAYPVQEQVGLVWVYPRALRAGGAPPEPLAVFDELLDPSFTLAPYDELWEAHLTRVVESVLDVAHLSFVHRKTIGRRLSPEVKRLQFTVPDQDTIVIENGGGVLEYRYPQQWILRPVQATGAKFINYVTFTPVDTQHTRIYGYAGRTFARWVPGLNRVFSRYSRRILREDQALVESQHPRPIPEALRMEAHVPADGPQVRFRQRWFEFLSGSEDKATVTEGYHNESSI